MSYIIVGLGNPGGEYEGTRHNTGRMALEYFARNSELGTWNPDKKLNALVTKGKIGGGKKAVEVKLVLPETMMNNSGKAVALLVKNTKQAEKLIVVHDDLDLPLGALKINFNRGDGGHHGLASVIKALKTRAFTRVRIGIAPTTPSGKIKKPATEQKVVDFILGRFTDREMAVFKKVAKRVVGAIQTIVTASREAAMSKFN